MATSDCCYDSTLPEITPVTINDVHLEVNGATTTFANEYITTASASYDTTYNRITLAYWPIDPSQVQLILNSGVQGQSTTSPGNNFSVSGNIVELLFTPAPTDLIHIHYMAYAGEGSAGDAFPGERVFYSGTLAPAGWLFCDGISSYAKADFPNAWLVANAQSLVDSSTATHFVLKNFDYTISGVVQRQIMKG